MRASSAGSPRSRRCRSLRPGIKVELAALRFEEVGCREVGNHPPRVEVGVVHVRPLVLAGRKELDHNSAKSTAGRDRGRRSRQGWRSRAERPRGPRTHARFRRRDAALFQDRGVLVVWGYARGEGGRR